MTCDMESEAQARLIQIFIESADRAECITQFQGHGGRTVRADAEYYGQLPIASTVCTRLKDVLTSSSGHFVEWTARLMWR